MKNIKLNLLRLSKVILANTSKSSLTLEDVLKIARDFIFVAYVGIVLIGFIYSYIFYSVGFGIEITSFIKLSEVLFLFAGDFITITFTFSLGFFVAFEVSFKKIKTLIRLALRIVSALFFLYLSHALPLPMIAFTGLLGLTFGHVFGFIRLKSKTSSKFTFPGIFFPLIPVFFFVLYLSVDKKIKNVEKWPTKGNIKFKNELPLDWNENHVDSKTIMLGCRYFLIGLTEDYLFVYDKVQNCSRAFKKDSVAFFDFENPNLKSTQEGFSRS